jgi:hypothetical protein
MTSIAFSVAGILLGIYALLLFGLFLIALVRGFRWRRQSEASAALVPEIREALVDYLSGSNDVTRLQSYVRNSRREIAEAMLSFQGTVGGNALDRLCELALTLTLVHDWVQEAHSWDVVRRRSAYARLAFVSISEACRHVAGDLLLQGLEDHDPEVRLWAGRSVVQSGSPKEIEAVFELAISQSLLMRILLTEALRRHAIRLCKHVVPEALRSSDSKRVLAVLDILVAWERAISIDNLRELLEHREKDVRLQALRLAPLVPLVPETRIAIVNALADKDAEVSMAAVLSAGRLQIAEALPALARMLRLAPAELARTAADALAEMPPRGWQALEEFSTSSNPVTAAAAAGALVRARQKAGL